MQNHLVTHGRKASMALNMQTIYRRNRGQCIRQTLQSSSKQPHAMHPKRRVYDACQRMLCAQNITVYVPPYVLGLVPNNALASSNAPRSLFILRLGLGLGLVTLGV
jgi:hypothetical protein